MTSLQPLLGEIGILAMLVILQTQLGRILDRRGRLAWPLAHGLLMGLGSGLIMMQPLQLGEAGWQVDGRLVPLALAGLIGGPVAGALAIVIAVFWRLALGGGFALLGAVGTALPALVGIAMHLWLQRLGAPLERRHLLVLAVVTSIAAILFIAATPTAGDADILYYVAGPASLMALTGIPLFGVLILQDAQRRQLERDLATERDRAQAADLVKARFMAQMGHELRTPLNAIIGLSEMISMDLQPDRRQEHARLVAQAGRHLLEILTGILDTIRLERQQLRLAESEVAALPLLRFVASLLEQRIHQGALTLTVDSAPGDLRVRCDETMMRQVLTNLAANAIRHTPPGGQVSLRASVEDEGIVFAVADTGSGIAPEDLPRVLKPFEQTAIRRTLEGGVGLGLPLSLGLVSLHGGRLELTSLPGQGTLARAILPLERLLPAMGTLKAA